MPKEEKVLHVIDDDEPNMEKEEDEDEHELRSGICNNKIILCMTTGHQKPCTEGLANIVMVEAFFKINININFI